MRTLMLAIAFVFSMATAAMAMPYATISKAESGEDIVDVYSEMQYDVVKNQWVVIDENNGGVYEEDEVAVVLHTNGAVVTNSEDRPGEVGFLIVEGGDEMIAGIVWLSRDDWGRILFSYETF